VAEAAAAAGGQEGPVKLHDFSLKGTVHIAVPKRLGSGGGGKSPAPAGAAGAGAAGGVLGEGAGPSLLPPPSLQPPPALLPPPVFQPPPAAPEAPAAAAEAAMADAGADTAADAGWASFDTPTTAAAGENDWTDFQS